VCAQALDPASARVVVSRSRREHSGQHVLLVEELDPDDLQADHFVAGSVRVPTERDVLCVSSPLVARSIACPAVINFTT